MDEILPVFYCIKNGMRIYYVTDLRKDKKEPLKLVGEKIFVLCNTQPHEEMNDITATTTTSARDEVVMVPQALKDTAVAANVMEGLELCFRGEKPCTP